MDNNFSINEKIRLKAGELGFHKCAILPVTRLTEEESHLQQWLEMGYHGEMSYMERNTGMRLDPAKLFDNAKSIILVLLNYFPSKTQTDSGAPVLSKYAYGIDYHFVLKDKLKELLEFIQKEIIPCTGRVFTDSAPVLERAWAKKAGFGWIGKNSNLITTDQGSFFFIGELLVDAELSYDNPRMVADHCGKCTRCIDACPTKAIVADKVVDARLCISYQTIELKDDLDKNLQGKFENRVFGCDICQDVCPWNLKSVPHEIPEFSPHEKLLTMTGNDWFEMDHSTFTTLFRKSAVKRTGFAGMRRNLEFIQTHGNEQGV